MDTRFPSVKVYPLNLETSVTDGDWAMQNLDSTQNVDVGSAKEGVKDHTKPLDFFVREREWIAQFFWLIELRARAGDETASLAKLLPEIPLFSHEVKELLAEVDLEFDYLRRLFEQFATPQSADGFKRKFYTVGGATKLFLYVAVRLLKPDIAIETGCGKGMLSFLVLKALQKNGKGHLYTIDFPASKKFQGEAGLADWKDELIGLLVPECLKVRWSLILGDVKHCLVPLLEKVGFVDLFVHDSDHSYPHMMWEYLSIWPYLKNGGLLVSDDITHSMVFRDFSRALKLPYCITRNNINVGAIRKPAV